MLSESEFKSLVKKIYETGGATDEMMRLMENLQDDFDERSGELARLGERADENPPEGFKKWKDALDDMTKQRDDEKERYKKRFFDGPGEKTHKEPDGDEGKPGPGDGDEGEKPKTYEDLFEVKSKKEKGVE